MAHSYTILLSKFGCNRERRFSVQFGSSGINLTLFFDVYFSGTLLSLSRNNANRVNVRGNPESEVGSYHENRLKKIEQEIEPG